MPTPKADPAVCDVFGCGQVATHRTDGSEIDSLEREAVPHLNVCDGHANWPHSEDAKVFALQSEKYKKRT